MLALDAVVDPGRCRMIGLAGSVALMAGGLTAGALPVREALVPSSGRAALGLVCAYFGLVLLVAAWWWLGRAVRGPGPTSPRALLLTLGTWAAPLLLGPPLFSRDVYSYLAQGAMVEARIDVYAYGPAHLGGPLATEVAPVWQYTPTPYGPVFLGLARGAADLVARFDLPAGILGMRLLALLGVGLMIAFLPSLARRCGVEPSAALWLGALNPLVLLHLVAGAHNDALMLGLLGAGLVAALGGWPLRGAVLVALAALVKAPAALGLLAVAVLWSSRLAGRLTPQPGGRFAPRLAGELDRLGTRLPLGLGARLPLGLVHRLRLPLGARLPLGLGARLPLRARLPLGLVHRLPPGLVHRLRTRSRLPLGLAGRTRTATAARLAIAVGLTGAVALATTAAVTAVTGTGYGWVGALSTPVSPHNWSLTSGLGRLTGSLLDAADSRLAEFAVPAWRWLGLAATAVAVGVLWLRVLAPSARIVPARPLQDRDRRMPQPAARRRDHNRRLGPVYALGLSLLAVFALGPAFRPWYALWGLFLIAAAAPDGRIRSWAAAGSGILALAVLPSGFAPDGLQLTLAVCGGALAVLALWWMFLVPGPGVAASRTQAAS
ncbi:polyprenol phosphomannose-dependent alpha 1,6 mannosyltransferase MptB [Streptomyces sp. 8N616]|uniref:polyprenol phosphomannose-dependent alpha 1,6 mannosyltransferase MptB n=1 Tax=Streptomyces sp. 8N616 TaxID=3457414 RepID=UPI003FCF873D